MLSSIIVGFILSNAWNSNLPRHMLYALPTLTCCLFLVVRTTFAFRVSSVAAPTVWNSLLAFVTHPLPILSVAFSKLSASSRPSAAPPTAPSDSPKCLSFGHRLTLCTDSFTYRQHLRSASQHGRRSFGGIEWTIMIGAVLLLWARRPGIRCQTVFLTQLWVLAFSGISRKHFICEILTIHTWHIRFFYENELYKFTLYILTYAFVCGSHNQSWLTRCCWWPQSTAAECHCTTRCGRPTARRLW